MHRIFPTCLTACVFWWFYLQISVLIQISQHQLSLQSIANNVIAGLYPSMKAFDMEMSRLFEKARRFYSRVTPPYGSVLAAQVGFPHPWAKAET